MTCAAGVIPGVLTLIAPRNGVLRFDAPFTDDQGPLDFTGWTARMQVRTSPGSVPALIDINSTAPNANGSMLSFIDPPSGGILEVFISNRDLNTLAVGSPVSSPAAFAFDVVLTEPGGDFAPYLQGAFLVTEGVTR